MKKLSLVLLVSLLSGFVFGQVLEGFEKRNKKRRNKQHMSSGSRKDAIYSHSRGHYRPFGWHISPGLTYTIGNGSEETVDLKASGLPGYYIEGGLAHLFKQRHKVFHYFDYGLGLKHYGGSERYTDILGNSNRGKFNFGSAFARIDIHSVWQLSKWNFINQSIGFNIDYRIYGGKIDKDYLSPLVPVNQEKLVGQLHYSLGWGYKPREGLYIIPTLQTPILTLLNWRNFNPGTRWFSSKYQPLIFTVKIGVLFPKKGCPKVFGKDAKRQADQYQNR